MNKFKASDVVMFKTTTYDIDTYSKFTELDLYQPQTVLSVDEDGCLLLAEDDGAWPSGLWEHFDEWEKHQRKVAPETELELAKMQIKMLQDFKKEALYLLRHAAPQVESQSLRQEINKLIGD